MQFLFMDWEISYNAKMKRWTIKLWGKMEVFGKKFIIIKYYYKSDGTRKEHVFQTAESE